MLISGRSLEFRLCVCVCRFGLKGKVDATLRMEVREKEKKERERERRERERREREREEREREKRDTCTCIFPPVQVTDPNSHSEEYLVPLELKTGRMNTKYGTTQHRAQVNHTPYLIRSYDIA